MNVYKLNYEGHYASAMAIVAARRTSEAIRVMKKYGIEESGKYIAKSFNGFQSPDSIKKLTGVTYAVPLPNKPQPCLLALHEFIE